MIVLIPRSEAGCKPGEFDPEWLPRRCPGCGETAVIGHGRRWRQAHDRLHDAARIRRGLCKGCWRTITVLSRACIPRAVYNLPARIDALTRVADGAGLEQAAPECRHPDRVAAASTIARWCERRIESPPVFALAHTLFAWDWSAAARMLIVETAPTWTMTSINGSLAARISLLDFLQQHGWKPVRDRGREEVAGGLARLMRLLRAALARGYLTSIPIS